MFEAGLPPPSNMGMPPLDPAEFEQKFGNSNALCYHHVLKNTVVSSSCLLVQRCLASARIQLPTFASLQPAAPKVGQPAAPKSWCLMGTAPTSSPTATEKRWRGPFDLSKTSCGATTRGIGHDLSNEKFCSEMRQYESNVWRPISYGAGNTSRNLEMAFHSLDSFVW